MVRYFATHFKAQFKVITSKYGVVSSLSYESSDNASKFSSIYLNFHSFSSISWLLTYLIHNEVAAIGSPFHPHKVLSLVVVVQMRQQPGIIVCILLLY